MHQLDLQDMRALVGVLGKLESYAFCWSTTLMSRQARKVLCLCFITPPVILCKLYMQLLLYVNLLLYLLAICFGLANSGGVACLAAIIEQQHVWILLLHVQDTPITERA